MKHSCIILLLAISPLVSMGQKTNLDSLYRCLDREITKSDQYIKVKQQHIDDIKLKYHRTHGDRVSRHQLAWNLFKANETFMNDSAIHYLNECFALSRQMKNSSCSSPTTRPWLTNMRPQDSTMRHWTISGE